MLVARRRTERQGSRRPSRRIEGIGGGFLLASIRLWRGRRLRGECAILARATVRSGGGFSAHSGVRGIARRAHRSRPRCAGARLPEEQSVVSLSLREGGRGEGASRRSRAVRCAAKVSRRGCGGNGVARWELEMAWQGGTGDESAEWVAKAPQRCQVAIARSSGQRRWLGEVHCGCGVARPAAKIEAGSRRT